LRGKLSSALSAAGKYLTAPLRFSLAARAAWVLFIFLTLLVVVVWSLVRDDPNLVTWTSYMTPLRLMLILALLVATPVATYYALRLWLEGERSRFPDIDFAFKSGIDALANHGIDVKATPVFLMLGSASHVGERILLAAGGTPLRVDSTPEGPAALHWYAHNEAIYLFCTQSCVTSSFSALVGRRTGTAEGPAGDSAEPPAAAQATPVAPSQLKAAGSVAEGFDPTAPGAVMGGSPSDDPPPTPSGTIQLDQFLAGRQAGEQAAQKVQLPAPAADEGQQTASRGTLMLDAPRAAPPPYQDAHDADSPLPYLTAVSGTGVDETLLTSVKVTEQLQRLKYLCQLLKRYRRPVCPINGVLALVPFATILGSRAESEELQESIKADVTTLQRELQLRAPVSALFVGLEHERGFRELVRRVGRDRAAAQRFGRKFDVRSIPTTKQMRALSAHVCGAFEDWIYTLFREHGALSHPGNTRLYSLLCKVRCTLKTWLADVLGGAFGVKEGSGGGDRVAFSGCYFAATGATTDRQAFVRGVLDKLVDEQELVEWTFAAVRNDRRHRWLAGAGIAVGVLLSVSLVALIVMASR